MRSILNLTNLATMRCPQIALACVITFLFTAELTQKLTAQCVEHHDKTTALKFSNESRFELTFFVDEDEEGVVVPSRTVSDEISVEPGEHLLRARAIVIGESFWVWAVNEVPQGQVCTWTVTDPPRREQPWRSILNVLQNHFKKSIGSKGAMAINKFSSQKQGGTKWKAIPKIRQQSVSVFPGT